jgi:hypothetical protein
MLDILFEHEYGSEKYEQMVSDAEQVVKMLRAGKLSLPVKMKDGTTQVVPFFYILDYSPHLWIMSRLYSKKHNPNTVEADRSENFIPLYRPLTQPSVYFDNPDVIKSQELLNEIENKLIEIFEDFGVTLSFEEKPLEYNDDFMNFSIMYNIYHEKNKMKLEDLK